MKAILGIFATTALCIGTGLPAFAAEKELEEIVKDAPPLAPTAAPTEKRRANLFGTLNDQQLLLVGLRLDAAYSGGGSVSQGFSIPSVRLTAWGQAGDLISYRFSLGQTREFSSVLLPQIMPVEAFIDFNSATAMDWDPKSRLTLRLGLFTPTFNPWWSPDLADIPMPIPDYQETHRALFLARDIGAEVQFEPIAQRLMFHVGLFNGSGIFSLNTNNSKAFTAGVRGNILFGPVKWTLGFSAMLHEQADPTSVNFRSDVVGNLFTSLELPGSDWRLTGEVFGGELNDSVRTAYPWGAAGTLFVPVVSGVRLFTRAEALRSSGIGNGFVRNAQIGPILELHKAAHAYLFYQYLDQGGSIENLGWLRLRLVL